MANRKETCGWRNHGRTLLLHTLLLFISAALIPTAVCLAQLPTDAASAALVTVATAHDEGGVPHRSLSTDRFTVVDSGSSIILFRKPYLSSEAGTVVPTGGGNPVEMFSLDDSTLLVVAEWALVVYDLSDLRSPVVLSRTYLDTSSFFASDAALSARGIFVTTSRGTDSPGGLLWYTWSRDSLALRWKGTLGAGVTHIAMIGSEFLVIAMLGFDSQELFTFHIGNGYVLHPAGSAGIPFGMIESMMPAGDHLVVAGRAPDMIATLRIGYDGRLTPEREMPENEMRHTLGIGYGNGLITRLSLHDTPVPGIAAIHLSLGSVETDGSIRWIDSTLVTRGLDAIPRPWDYEPLHQVDSNITLVARKLSYEFAVVDSTLVLRSILKIGDECLDLDVVDGKVIAATNRGLDLYHLDPSGALGEPTSIPVRREHVVWVDARRAFAHDRSGLLLAIDDGGEVTVLDSMSIVEGLSRRAATQGDLIAIPLFDRGLVLLSAHGDSLSEIYRDSGSCNDACWRGDTLLTVGESRSMARYIVSEGRVERRSTELPSTQTGNFSIASAGESIFIGNEFRTVEYMLADTAPIRSREWAPARQHLLWLGHYVYARAENTGVFTVVTWPEGTFVNNLYYEGDGRIVASGENLVSASGRAGLRVSRFLVAGVEERSVEMRPSVAGISVVPNPAIARAEIQIDARTGGRATIEIFSVDGRRVLEQDAELRPGVNRLPIDLSSIHSGTFIVVVKGEGKILATKLLVCE
jgi:hypothetical protein